MKHRTYRELRRIDSFEERFEYLRLKGQVGDKTFGFDRWVNQNFYSSRQWKDVRSEVIARDLGCDMGVEGHEIYDRILIHHMNPMTLEQIEKGYDQILDPDNLISVSHATHNAIHYGDANLLPKEFVPRRPGDTKLWGRR